MIDNKLITDEQLRPFCTAPSIETTALADMSRALLAQQKDTWELPRKGYESLKSVETRNFEFDGFNVKVQFNPGRIVSSSAKVDAASIKERKCFLCYNHLPQEQKGIRYGSDYLILCNPFPIFTEHFTIPHIEHTPQRIDTSYSTALDLCRDLSAYYTVFYNGPKCGASAPDHLHFQAGEKFFMPIDQEYENIRETLGKKIADNGMLQIYAVDGYLRKFISFESSDKQQIETALDLYLKSYQKISAPGEEPMMNMLFFYGNGKWRVLAFPRDKHRPSYYFAEGDDNILLSPASVDMGGVLITPLEKDFLKITKDNIIDIFAQVTASEERFGYLTKELGILGI